MLDDEDYQLTLADRAAGRAEAMRQPREEVDKVQEVDAEGVPCRLYEPAGATGLIVHFHGGGFVFHDVESHDAPVRRLANRTGSRVLSVDYRLAPEHPFPAAVHDGDAVVRWVAGREWDGPIVAHGDSAGGNLAIVAALRNPGAFAGVAATYPFLDPTSSFPSYSETTTWDREDAQWFWSQYAPGADPNDPDLNPLASPDLATLPPTLVITAEQDIVRDEGEAFAQRVGAELVRYDGVPHGFWRQFEDYPESDRAMRRVAAFISGLSHPR
jgi:acetyl esterase